ncbi:MAG: hypothetical protein Q8P06_00835 [Candidatus Azambacteria bacterium]|nr:hypothetical protein [Candidatus Azambacteria bacterium]
MKKSRRVLKRIFIAVVYLAIFGGLGIGGYFLFRPTTVPPPLVTPPIIRPIEVIWSRIFVVGPGLYSVAAKIKNPNIGFSAGNFGYTFNLYDAEDKLITSPVGESFIWLGESKYIVVGGIGLNKIPTKVSLQINNPVWREVKDFGGIDLALGNIKYGEGAPESGKFFAVDFTANNGTPYNLKKTYVSAIVFDKEENPIAAATTLLENLKSKEHRRSNISWFSAFPGSPNRVDLTISTNFWGVPGLISQ